VPEDCPLSLACASEIWSDFTMRLWTLHPKYLDAKGLVALWREALLAQKVLRGKTKGYRHHPQLLRFQAQAHPAAAVATYLTAVHAEATRRGYQFDGSKIGRCNIAVEIPETNGQILYEWQHLKRKLKQRAPNVLAAHKGVSLPEPHPIFKVVRGKIREWELVTSTRPKPSSSTPRRVSKASARPHRISPRHKS
jgi:hypothetical protein